MRLLKAPRNCLNFSSRKNLIVWEKTSSHEKRLFEVCFPLSENTILIFTTVLKNVLFQFIPPFLLFLNIDLRRQSPLSWLIPIVPSNKEWDGKPWTQEFMRTADRNTKNRDDLNPKLLFTIVRLIWIMYGEFTQEKKNKVLAVAHDCLQRICLWRTRVNYASFR